MSRNYYDDQIKQNSKDWHTADDPGKKKLEQANKDLYADMDKNYGSASSFDASTGKWNSSGGSTKRKPSQSSYESGYSSTIDDLLSQVMNPDSFTYNHTDDPLYQQYEKSYTKNGQRAMEDTVGQLSMRTGGLGSSYAQTAGQQTYDGYMSALSDTIPQLEQAAYGKYMDEQSRARGNLSILQGLEQNDYGRYRDSVGDKQWQSGFDFNSDQAALADTRWEQEFAFGQEQYGDGKEQDTRAWDYGVAQDIRDWDYGVAQDIRNWDYGVGRDQIGDARFESEKSDAKSLLRAQLLAAAGDFSGYKALGLSDEEISIMDTDWDKRQQSGGGGGGSYSGGGGSSTLQELQYYDPNALFNDAYSSGSGATYIRMNGKAYGLSASQIDYVVADYMEQEEARFNASETGNANGGATVEWVENILDLGYGPIAPNKLQEMIRQGEIIKTMSGGVIRYARNHNGMAGWMNQVGF